MEILDIVSIFVAFKKKADGKIRPVLIVKDSADIFYAYAITSQYENKSKQIQSQYYQIRDWKNAGLMKPSWIDGKSLHGFHKNQSSINRIIGKLSDNDTQCFAEFLKEIEFADK